MISPWVEEYATSKLEIMIIQVMIIKISFYDSSIPACWMINRLLDPDDFQGNSSA
jgi:hypothetical protein